MDSIRTRRAKTISKKLGIVTEEDKTDAVQARIAALEDDGNTAEDFQADGSDEEFQLEESDEELRLGESKRKKKRKTTAAAKRTTRAGGSDAHAPRSFPLLLEEAESEARPGDEPIYRSAAVGAGTTFAPRKWCTVCGFPAPYTCTRCSSRFCTKKCYAVHSETRCLKFTT